MPHKDPEKRKEAIRKWRAANREKIRVQQREYRAAKRARAKERGDPGETGSGPG